MLTFECNFICNIKFVLVRSNGHDHPQTLSAQIIICQEGAGHFFKYSLSQCSKGTLNINALLILITTLAGHAVILAQSQNSKVYKKDFVHSNATKTPDPLY